MLTKKEVQYIAKLSRLGLTEKEIGKFQKELSKIFDYIEKLKEVDVLNVEPTTHSIILTENVLRKDEIREQENRETRKKIIEQAPEIKQNYIKVRTIFN